MADAHTDAAMRICLMTEHWNRTACVSDAATADGEIVNRNESCSVERIASLTASLEGSSSSSGSSA